MSLASPRVSVAAPSTTAPAKAAPKAAPSKAAPSKAAPAKAAPKAAPSSQTAQGKSSASATKAKSLSTAPSPVQSFAAAMPTRRSAGFRMEGAPKIQVVFGDIEFFKQHIDVFRDLHAKMEETHASFADASHRVQSFLITKRQGKRVCPTDEIAEDYAMASEAGLRYQHLGAELESSYEAIHELDELGESAGLTPDYRWQVGNSKRVYRAALVDLREMRAVFKSQLSAEVRAQGCKEQLLLARAIELRDQEPSTAVAVSTSGETATPDTPIVASSTATFFVDNQGCSEALRVFVDNTLLGEVAPSSRAAFQSLAGRHSICVLAADDSKSCGDTGTVRTAFLHNGFAMSRACSAQE